MSLGCFAGKSSSKCGSKGGLGSSGSPPRAPSALCQCPCAGAKPQQGPGWGWVNQQTLLYALDLFPYLPGEGGPRVEGADRVDLSQTDGRGEHPLHKIITVPISFILLAKTTAYNNIWPWKLNYVQPRSLWERWWLHPSLLSRLEKPSPKDPQPILSFSFPFNHSKTLSRSFS